MATCLNTRRGLLTTKMFKNLTMLDVMCPVCRGIFIKPVVLPCSHGLCLECFERTMEETSLTCPMCRKRVGSWLRTATKDRNLVNNTLWKAIQKLFPEQVKKKLDGDDDGLEERLQLTTPALQLSNPGDIRREYEVQKRYIEEENQRKYETECRASEQLIKIMQDEEEQNIRTALESDAQVARELQEQAAQEKECEEEKAKHMAQVVADEQLARQLHEQTAQSTSTVAKRDVSDKENKNRMQTPVTKGPLDNYLKSIRLLATTDNSSNIKMGFPGELERVRSSSNVSSASHDSINQEMLHFKPIKIVPRTPPKRLPDGQLLEPKLIRATPVNLNHVYEAVEAGQPIETLLSSSMQIKLSQQQRERLSVTNKTFGSSKTSAFKELSLPIHKECEKLSVERKSSPHKRRRSDDYQGACTSGSRESGQKVIALVHSEDSNPLDTTSEIYQDQQWRVGLSEESSKARSCVKRKECFISKNFSFHNEDSDDSDTDYEPADSVSVGCDNASTSSYSENSEVQDKGRGLSSSSERRQCTEGQVSQLDDTLPLTAELSMRRSNINNNITKDVDGEVMSCEEQARGIADAEAARLVAEEQARIETMLLQERTDLELAIRLSHEWEKMDRNIDRTKGSANPYALRNNVTATRRKRASIKKVGGGRQRTLEEVFSSPMRTKSRQMQHAHAT